MPRLGTAPNVELDWQRARLDDARRELARAAVAQREAELRLRTISRASAPSEVKAIAQAALEAAGARRAAAERQRAEAAGLLKDLAQHVEVTPEAEFARLSADVPVVLLPVRVETRFRGAELLLRVYPDDIFAEAHEPELTDGEIADGEKFWRAAWPGELEERAAWKVLVDALAAPRAAWVARALTPTNLVDRPGQAPAFPAPARRTGSWTRAAEAHLLPDRWLAIFYRGGQEVGRRNGKSIVEPLALTMAPTADASDRSPLTDDGLVIDDAVRWTVDFDAAEEAGMALRLALSTEDKALGFDRVLVVGVKSSLAPERGPAELGALLEQHRYDRGVALVPQGTPTNNSAEGPTAYPPADADRSTSFALERQGLTVKATDDGGRLMAALGLPVASAAHMENADCDGERGAAAMARALWPVTLGYFLEQMMAPVFSQAGIDATQRFFVRHVRGRGSLPAFRIGNTPYGVLPVSSLDAWQAADACDPVEAELPAALRTLRQLWLERVAEVPHVGKTSDPDADLLQVLGMDASTREVRVRSVLGEGTQWNLFGFLGYADAWPAWRDFGRQLAAQLFTRLGHPDWQPRIGRFNYGAAASYAGPLVEEAPLSESDGLMPNYVDWISRASVPELNAQALPEGTAPPNALLYRLLRHAMLLEFHDGAFQLLLRYGRVTPDQLIEAELVGLPGQKESRLERLAQPLAQVSGAQPLHKFLEDPVNAPLLRTLLPEGKVLDLRDALKILAPLPSAELERLCGETLDTASHRLDAWISALVAKRLAEMRAQKPAGCHLGAFGWLEDVRPKPAGAPVVLPGGRVAERQADNGGYVHAPSMTHAGAAAVLRNAYLSHSGTDRARYSVDLSSERVRIGRFVLDAVREGQPLGAVLGYRIERGLHERGFDVLIDKLRALYPLVAKKANDPADVIEITEKIAARNVVDGLLLRRAYQEQRIPWGTQGLPASGPVRDGVEAELAALDGAADAVSDLLLAESIYQLVKGSPSVAAATLDAMGQGTVRPPDPEIISQPRRGTPLTHKVAIILGEGAPVLPAGWSAQATPRAAAEPNVDAWLGTLFGDATKVSCRVEIGPNAAPTGIATVRLSDLGLRPIDMLMLGRAQAQADPAAVRAAASELDRRIQDIAYDKLAVTTEVETRIIYELIAGADRKTTRSFGDILEIARATTAVLAKSRALAATDLLADEQAGLVGAADLLPGDAITRASAARDLLIDAARVGLAPALAAAKTAPEVPDFDLTPLRVRLRAVALAGVPSAYPLTARGNGAAARAELIAQATSVQEELERRILDAGKLIDDAALPEHSGDPAYRVRAAKDAIAKVLGADMPFLPLFVPAEAAELGNAIGHSASVGFIAADGLARERQIRRFEMTAARVRPALDTLRRVELLARTLGRSTTARAVVQLPYSADGRWVAMPFAAEKDRPKPGMTSILLCRVAVPAVNGRWSGLLLDAWTELIPKPEEQTGIAFHYDDAGAEAPQVILVAVPPAPAKSWDLGSLVATLNETLDLAKIRAVDGELLGIFGQLLPAIYLADSTDDVTVRTSFVGALRAEAVLHNEPRADG